MVSLREVIDSALRGNNNFCCLCFKCFDIDQAPSFSSLDDIITLNINNTDHYLTIHEVLESLLAPEINQYLSENEKLCSKCVESATNSYTFKWTSKSNMSLLTKAIETLTDSAENAIYELTSDTTLLYLSLDTDNITSNYIFNTKTLNTMPTKTTSVLNDTRHMDKCLVKKDDIPTMKVKRKRQKLLPKHYKIPKQYECSQCSLILQTKQSLKQHERENHTKYPCPLCGKILPSSQALKRHETYHTSSLVCQYCGRTYKTKQSYETHIKLNICKSETRANPSNAKFTCDYCNKKYTQKVSLRVHIQFEHGKYKAHICEWCGKKFWAQSRLKAHIVKHTKERNFVCSICGGKFVTKEALLYHTRLHTGEKPYNCTLCNSSFLSASRRSDHMKRYHAGTCLQCDMCPSRFNSGLYLERHREICHKPQLQKSSLQGKDVKVRYVKNNSEMNKNHREIGEISVSELEKMSGVDAVHNLIYQMSQNGQEDNVSSYGMVL